MSRSIAELVQRDVEHAETNGVLGSYLEYNLLPNDGFVYSDKTGYGSLSFTLLEAWPYLSTHLRKRIEEELTALTGKYAFYMPRSPRFEEGLSAVKQIAELAARLKLTSLLAALREYVSRHAFALELTNHKADLKVLRRRLGNRPYERSTWPFVRIQSGAYERLPHYQRSQERPDTFAKVVTDTFAVLREIMSGKDSELRIDVRDMGSFKVKMAKPKPKLHKSGLRDLQSSFALRGQTRDVIQYKILCVPTRTARRDVPYDPQPLGEVDTGLSSSFGYDQFTDPEVCS